jgi:predicted ATP-grasp superfamily ATP-dependent carboligase
VSIPFAPFESFELLSNKWKLFKLAQQLDIATPLTYYVKNIKEISEIIPKLRYPVVLKPCQSNIFLNGKWLITSVKYADKDTDLEEIVAKSKYLNRYPFLIQECIRGEGQGIFSLYDNGKPVVFFAHKRLREKPPSGGVSVLSKSIEVDPVQLQVSQKILDYVKWHGLAMVEFKVTPNGTPFIMEINARFWGSLQLAINAGVDFPWLLYQMAIGKSVEKIDSYGIGVKNRWLMGDIDHFFIKMFKEDARKAIPFFKKWQECIKFMKFYDKNTRYEVNRWDDFKPFLFELKKYFLDIKI